MSDIKLSEHRFHKGKFISPWNDMGFTMTQTPWFQRRLPEYLWIGLILDKYGRSDGLQICGRIIQQIKNLNLQTLCFSELLELKQEDQVEVWATIADIAGVETLSPITAIVCYSEHPLFASRFSCIGESPEERIKKVGEILKKGADHQSYFSTDIRFVALYFMMVSGKIKFFDGMKSEIEQILKYPYLSHDEDEMKMIRPAIRSSEMMSEPKTEEHNKFIRSFWESVSIMTDCELYILHFEPEAEDADAYEEKIKDIMGYYSDMFKSAYPLDNKMLVLLGIATYSYKRLLELINCNLYNEISGRSIVRVMVENYIMMKYLLKHETDHDDIWTEYQYYGIGQYKLIAKRADDATFDTESSHVPYKYLDVLVSEFRDDKYVDMDTKYFDKHNIREKAIDVGEKDLFGLFYDYDSAFEHGLWGAVRESSLFKCDAAEHQFHCVPDITNEKKLKSVWKDAKTTMNKILRVLKEVYGLPEKYAIDEDLLCRIY